MQKVFFLLNFKSIFEKACQNDPKSENSLKGYLAKNEEVWRFSKHISHPENEDMGHSPVRTVCHSSIPRVSKWLQNGPDDP